MTPNLNLCPDFWVPEPQIFYPFWIFCRHSNQTTKIKKTIMFLQPETHGHFRSSLLFSNPSSVFSFFNECEIHVLDSIFYQTLTPSHFFLPKLVKNLPNWFSHYLLLSVSVLSFTHKSE